MTSAPIPAILLAAGASRRLGQPKQLLRLDGESLLQRALRVAFQAGATPVFAILGAHAENIRASVNFELAIPILNGQWEQGMATSIHAGLRALDSVAPAAPGVLILACDQPRLSAAHLRALLDAFAAGGPGAIAASTYAGVTGIPAVFPRAFFPALRALEGDRGARALLAHPPCPLISLPFPGGDLDIDLPPDLACLDPNPAP